ncbi:MAG TPA: DinB family protein [Thermoanaerobaculia bacterium]
MTFASPYTREQIIDALERQESESRVFWNKFDTNTFFRRIGQSWSPAETVRHLIKSTGPVGQALRVPKIVLRWKFGRATHDSRNYDELRMAYLKTLNEGGQAGRFAPSPRQESDLEAWRAKIMADFAKTHRVLRARAAKWSEKQLDHLQLPHPLLGPLTVREMLLFTLYHQKHHVSVVERHLNETRQS